MYTAVKINVANGYTYMKVLSLNYFGKIGKPSVFMKFRYIFYEAKLYGMLSKQIKTHALIMLKGFVDENIHGKF